MSITTDTSPSLVSVLAALLALTLVLPATSYGQSTPKNRVEGMESQLALGIDSPTILASASENAPQRRLPRPPRPRPPRTPTARTPAISTIAVLPLNAIAYENVFGRTSVFTDAKRRDMQRFRSRTEQVASPVLFLGRQNQGLADVRRHLRETETPLVSFFGHNDGTAFRFPDGSVSTFPALSQLAKKYGKVPIFLSCEARPCFGVIGTNDNITFSQGIGLLDLVRRSIESHREESGELPASRLLQRVIEDAEWRRRSEEFGITRVKWLDAGVVISLAGALGEDDDDDENGDDDDP